MVVPTLDEVDGERSVFHGRPIKADAGAGIMGSQADRYSVLNAVVLHLRDGIGHKRFPVAHPNVGSHVQRTFHAGGLLPCDFCQGRAPDERIPVLDLFDHGVGQTASPSHAPEKFRNLFHLIGTAVRQKEHGLFPLSCLYQSVSAKNVF
jgi:hypothetical protein